MTWRRIKLYLFGVGLGLLLSLALFKGKNFEGCSPQSRVSAQIGAIRKLDIDSTLLARMQQVELSSDSLRTKLAGGKVDFDRSQAQKEPCREYLVKFSNKGKNLEAYIQLCLADSSAKLLYLEGEGLSGVK